MKETFSIQLTEELKYKMLGWANRFNIFCLLDNCGYEADAGFDYMLAAGAKRSIQPGDNVWSSLYRFHSEKPSWLFGHIGYEAGSPFTAGKHRFNKFFFFEPEILIRISGNQVEIISDNNDKQAILEEIRQYEMIPHAHHPLKVNATISQRDYVESVEKIRAHIHRGDCYELNFCQEFYAEGKIDPLDVYRNLVKRSPNPFSAFYKLDNWYCLCASPERFLKKTGDILISQPIKGTSKRYADKIKDEESRQYLQNSTKERSENIMVVDLVRNDLGRVCTPGTVKVKELCGIYAFPQVYQMISTIEGRLNPSKNFAEAIEACFPMGSMTGAPKVRVMELIRQYEKGARGLFSGSIGYISPEADFDFNVVIRSLFVDVEDEYVSFLAGGGITFKSDPVQEYAESMLKAQAIRDILEGS